MKPQIPVPISNEHSEAGDRLVKAKLEVLCFDVISCAVEHLAHALRKVRAGAGIFGFYPHGPVDASAMYPASLGGGRARAF
ncbi:MAG: hypothetical protein F4Z06_00440 [Acidimicrobiia bacterium]|nr:hypothetical protein [Acidimicrobiia bacterium]MYE74246.1 hypothetical protein [Acidimicrobiia bacterium]MYJ61753.1 hypothetical protein [Acidimicrobiia bacterium]